MNLAHPKLTPERRAWLSLKGQLLYGKYCGTLGQGICAENFALYHLRRGETEVVVDFLAYLEQQLVSLRQVDHEQQLAMTEQLAARIRRQLSLQPAHGSTLHVEA